MFEAGTHEQALVQVQALNWLESHGDGRLVAAGHRVVHCGVYYAEPVCIDEAAIQSFATQLTRIKVIMPHLHQIHSL